jgi:hypothetical protein
VGGKAMSVPKDYMNDPRVIDAVSDLQARNDRLVAAGYKPRSIEQEQKKWAQIFEEKDLNNSELEYKQRSAERASKSPAYQFLNKDQIDSINQYSDRLDRNAEGRNQVINSIENEAKKRGLTIENVSQSKGGNSKSLYIRNSNNELIRVSDHELPMTPEREHNRAQGLMGKWDRDLVIDDWLNKSLDDHMDEIEQKQQPMSISD